MIAKFEGFVSLTPESDFFYSLEHQPLVTDSIGRAFELRQPDPPQDPALTDTVIETIGGGGYFEDTYNNVIISTQNFPIDSTPVIQAPAFAESVAAVSPMVWQAIRINVAGVAPETFLNETWTGESTTTASSNPVDIYTPDWTRSGLLTAENYASRFEFGNIFEV